MADLIKSLFEIGDCFIDEKAKASNKITEKSKIYKFEISDLSKPVYAEIEQDMSRHVCTRRTSAGKLFYPTILFINKEDFKRQLLKGFEVQNSNADEAALDALKIFINAYDSNENIIDIDGVNVQKGESCFISLTYKENTYYEIFPELFDEYCNNPEIIDGVFDGVDFPTQKVAEIGYDANLPFCSSNEIVNENLAKSVKKHLLHLSKSSASRVKLGFELAIKGKDFNFSVGTMKMSVLPSILGDVDTADKKRLFNLLRNLRDKDDKSNHNVIGEKIEDFIEELLYVADVEQESKLAVVNTILLFEQSNAKIAILKMINDISPSQILNIKNAMKYDNYNITTSWSNYLKTAKAHSMLEANQDDIAFYLPFFLKDDLNIGKSHNANIFLLDDRKIGEAEFLNNAARLNFKGGYRTGFRDIQRLADFLYTIDKIPEKIILRKMEDFKMEIQNVEELEELLKDTPLINNVTLKTAYWMGALYHFLTAREHKLSDKSILKRRRNILGILDYKKLAKLYELLEATAIKIEKMDEKRSIGKKASYCRRKLIENYIDIKDNTSYAANASSIQLAFSAGEEDAKKIKRNKNSEEEN
jgi:hypothetical protein